MEQPWRLTLRDSDFGEIGGSRGRILVVEEDLAFYDPARPQEAPLSPRLVYAEVASDGSLPTPPPEPDPPEKPPFFEDIPRR
jgi:hypothetical protein